MGKYLIYQGQRLAQPLQPIGCVIFKEWKMKNLILLISMMVATESFAFGSMSNLGSLKLNNVQVDAKMKKEKKRKIASKKPKLSYLEELRRKFNAR